MRRHDVRCADSSTKTNLGVGLTRQLVSRFSGVTDDEFPEVVRVSAAAQLEANRQHYAGLIAGSVRRAGLSLVFEFEAHRRPGTTYAHRASALPESDESRDADGVAGELGANWIEIVEARDVDLPERSGHAIT